MDSIAVLLALKILAIAAEQAPELLASLLERGDGARFRAWAASLPPPGTPGKATAALERAKARARGRR